MTVFIPKANAIYTQFDDILMDGDELRLDARGKEHIFMTIKPSEGVEVTINMQETAIPGVWDQLDPQEYFDMLDGPLVTSDTCSLSRSKEGGAVRVVVSTSGGDGKCKIRCIVH